jgi:hypothetical protein
MNDDLEQNTTSWPSRLGGVLIFLGTGLSMILKDWQAEAAMAAALIGLVLVLAGNLKTR